MNILILIVILMGVVTYIPRMLPIVFLSDKKLPGFLKRFLYFIPYAALGALIFPGIFTSTETTQSAILGCVVSIVMAYFRLNIILVVLGGIGSVFLFGLLF